MNTAALLAVDTAKLQRAFDLVDPSAHAKRLAALGLIPAEVAKGASWKDQIAEIVTDRDLETAGVTIDDVREAIAFYTATEATITRHQIGRLYADVFDPPIPGYLVLADGYRAGPAGDH